MTDHDILDWLRDNVTVIERSNSGFTISYTVDGTTMHTFTPSIKEAVRRATGAKYVSTYAVRLGETD